MTAVELLTTLHTCGAKVWPAGDRLLVDAPRGVLTDTLREAIRRHKPDLLSLLRWNTQPEPERPGKVGRHGAPCPRCGDTWHLSTHPQPPAGGFEESLRFWW